MDPLLILQAIEAATGVANAFKSTGGGQVAASPVGGSPGGGGPLSQLPLQQPQPAAPGLDPASLGIDPSFFEPQAAIPPPVPATPGGGGEEQKTPSGQGEGVGDILAALPEAIAIASDLLGFNNVEQRTPAPVAGSANAAGQVVPGLQLPQGMSIGQLLAALPRLR